MKFTDYCREKAGWMFCFLGQMLLVIGMGKIFRINTPYIVSVVFLECFILLLMWAFDFRKKYKFYQDMLKKLDELDKKYLITEMIEKPGFLEGDILCDALYETDRSMNEKVSGQERAVREFKDYVEMWIHEIKLPISAVSLMNHNEEMDFRSYRQQLDKISQLVEQILYYVRADTPQKDYLMKRCCLEEIINEVLLEHKDVLITGKFTIQKKDTGVFVVSDAKWIKFMLGQLIHNSVKYKRGASGYLGFQAVEEDGSVTLIVEDHGIGVPASDVRRVFEKSFTGENGRKTAASTGMGLYICRKMCGKLGHEIWMEAAEGEWTKVMIRFGKDGYYLE